MVLISYIDPPNNPKKFLCKLRNFNRVGLIYYINLNEN